MWLVNLSNLPWVPKRLKRNQAIFQYLLSAQPFQGGLFINPPVVRNPATQPEWRLPYLAPLGRQHIHGKPVDILQPVFTLPFTWRAPIQQLSARLIARAIQRHLTRQPYVLWMNSIIPLSAALAQPLAPQARLRVFDSSDDFVEFETTPEGRNQAQQVLNQVLAMADRVLAVNEHVCAKLPHPHKRVFLNCTDFANFQNWDPGWTLAPFFPKPPHARYIGFTGGLNRGRADFELLEKLFLHFPGCQFLFVGYTNDPSIPQWLSRFPNAAFVSEVAYDDLSHVIHNFDVAIVPHLDNERTRGNDLLKVLDYLACSIPVVTTRCSNVERYASACYIAPTHEDFLAVVARLLENPQSHDPKPGLEIARQRSWKTQVQELSLWILEALSLSCRRDGESNPCPP
jgi:glycosyltransferase involved in cell wall biosynthesis